MKESHEINPQLFHSGTCGRRNVLDSIGHDDEFARAVTPLVFSAEFVRNNKPRGRALPRFAHVFTRNTVSAGVGDVVMHLKKEWYPQFFRQKKSIVEIQAAMGDRVDRAGMRIGHDFLQTIREPTLKEWRNRVGERIKTRSFDSTKAGTDRDLQFRIEICDAE